MAISKNHNLKIGIVSDTHGDEMVCRKIWQEYY